MHPNYLVQNHHEISALLDFLSGKNIKNVIEIGTQRGGTAELWANLVKPDGKVYCIDFFNNDPDYRRSDLANHIVEIKGNSRDIETINKLNNLLNDTKVDMLFIDGDHSYEGVMADYFNYRNFVRDRGLIVFHDIVKNERTMRWGTYVYKFWNKIKNENCIEFISDISNPCPMGIGIKVNHANR
jgi:predicted O-methyltransferase YrrM